jgi:hypothetical protein
MYAIIKFNPKGSPDVVYKFPDWAKSRTVLLSAAMAILVTFENISDVPLVLSQLGLPMGVADTILHWINVLGFIGAIIFRIQAKQPLGIQKGKPTSFTEEELKDLRKILEEKSK